MICTLPQRTAVRFMPATWTSPSLRRARYLGIVVARTILTGDVDLARRIAGNCVIWNVPEARAIAAACRVARERFAGCSISIIDFLGGRS